MRNRCLRRSFVRAAVAHDELSFDKLSRSGGNGEVIIDHEAPVRNRSCHTTVQNRIQSIDEHFGQTSKYVRGGTAVRDFGDVVVVFVPG